MSTTETVPPDVRAAMRWLSERAAQPRPRVCALCGRAYQGAGRSLYCCTGCKLRAFRQRQRAGQTG